MKILEDLKYEIVSIRREREIRNRIFLAEDKKEKLMLDEFERWIDLIEKEIDKKEVEE